MIHVYAGVVSVVLAIVAAYAAAIRVRVEDLTMEVRSLHRSRSKWESRTMDYQRGVDHLVNVYQRDIHKLLNNTIALLEKPIITWDLEEK